MVQVDSLCGGDYTIHAPFIVSSVMDDASLCDGIIQLHKDSDCKRAGLSGDNKVNKQVKDSTDVDFSHTSPLFHPYMTELQKTLDKFIALYPSCNNDAPFTVLEGVNIQHYMKGEQAYHAWHSEKSFYVDVTIPRHLTFVTYLNDVPEGGETEFLYQKVRIKPKKGTTVIFPVEWMFTHRGLPSEFYDKYIVTGWFSFYKHQNM